MKRVLVLSLLAVSLTWWTLPAQAANRGVRVLKATTSVDAAPPGTRVVFQAFATNLGPGPLDLWVGFDYGTLRNIDPDTVRETCIGPIFAYGYAEWTPDDPTCEWDEFPEGDIMIVKVDAQLAGSPHQVASITFCADGGNCKTARIRITS
jgi:hypothetical protein